MKEGSLVECVYDFSEEREAWGFDYPEKGDILTVSGIIKPPLPLQVFGIVMLSFYEKPNLNPLADKRVNGKPNFIEVISTEEQEKIEAEIGLEIPTT